MVTMFQGAYNIIKFPLLYDLFILRYLLYNSNMYGPWIPAPRSVVFDWICPHCDRPTTITSESRKTSELVLSVDNADGPRLFSFVFIVCPNPNCKKFTLIACLSEAAKNQLGDWVISKELNLWQLIPPSGAKSFPEGVIPKPVLNDYIEACLIKDLSPKASATLSRRCLQGMIRDFWVVQKRTLKDEIDVIKDKVDSLTWQAIDTVRTVGNIGAHMEKDINSIIDVEPNEAELLIGLIEFLFKDWYIAREDKKTRLTSIVELGKQKSNIEKSF